MVTVTSESFPKDLEQENTQLKETIDKLEITKIENEIRIQELEYLLKDYVEEAENNESIKQEDKTKYDVSSKCSTCAKIPDKSVGEVTGDPYGLYAKQEGHEVVESEEKTIVKKEKIDKETQTAETEKLKAVDCDTTSSGEENIKSNDSSGPDASDDLLLESHSDLKKKLDDAYKIIVMQESNISENEKKISLLERKIKQWGLEDKILEDSPPPRRKSSVRGKDKTDENYDDKCISKTPKNIVKRKIVQSGSPEKRSRRKVEAHGDVDPDHPTSSFNLRMKGRSLKKTKKLVPFGPFKDVSKETILCMMHDLGAETKKDSVTEKFFALRNLPAQSNQARDNRRKVRVPLVTRQRRSI